MFCFGNELGSTGPTGSQQSCRNHRIGQICFKSKLEESKEIFAGYEFKVEKVFRGSANETIIAGIDRFDVSWAVESQEEDGKFLLFLQRSPETDFLVPVGGPNGMIRVRKGVANGTDKAFYQKFLNSAAKEPVYQIEDEKKMSTMNKIIAAGSGLAFVLFIGIKLKRRTLKK